MAIRTNLLMLQNIFGAIPSILIMLKKRRQTRDAIPMPKAIGMPRKSITTSSTSEGDGDIDP